jgi:acetoin utilization deacetylase AcuC-like enzyme
MKQNEAKDNTMPIKIYSHPDCIRHDSGPGHAESPARLAALLDMFATENLAYTRPEPAELEWIARAHPMRYIDAVQDSMPDDGIMHLDSDTVVGPESFDIALLGAGAVCQAVADVVAGHSTRAFCAMRPPGHHAEPEKAMGFCLFNNVFIGALHAQALGLKRVAIVDFDVHHGNGSDAMVRDHADILFISSHQWPLYPGTGGPDDQIQGRLINLPLPAGTDGAEFRKVYNERVFPALHDFAPDLLMISAGFDAHRDDPLAQMNLVEDDFEWVTRELCALCPRVVSVLEGGYNIPALVASVRAHLRGMA